jgi:peroxiredoxin/cytochrome c-type biogenesis protein CcmH/NrfG
MSRRLSGCLMIALALGAVTPVVAQTKRTSTSEALRLGHSAHGDAFDEGPRQKPWPMTGIGHSHFPITTSVPEVQQWFDQGHTLLHSFWDYEAERAFRWCVKLDPECAMAYWGLSRAVGHGGDEATARRKAFLKEALRRKDKVTPRERLYLEAWEAAYLPDPTQQGDDGSSQHRLVEGLEKIAIQFPDDIEAKALLALETMGQPSRYGTELIVREILAREPDHPGAHHYRIHNWDGPQGTMALESCARFGLIAPDIGHANHMPGHVYSGLGMWHEAAIWMDSATRVEQRYMQQCLALPFNTWNYAHNRNYLAYIQEQLGMPEAALAGARELIAAPIDPRENDPDKFGRSVYREGLKASMRTLVKYERWSELKDIPWRKTTEDKMWQAYCGALAALAQSKLDDAADRLRELNELKADVEKPDNGLAPYHKIQCREVTGLLHLARGDTLEGLAALGDAAQQDLELRKDDNDPPDYPRVVYDVLGEAYLATGSAALAIKAFEKTLTAVPSDGFALAGLARAQLQSGNRAAAEDAYGQLLAVWSVAEPGNRWLDAARALGLTASPKDTSPAPQRRYDRSQLTAFGPASWEPYDAPHLDALDSKGQHAALEDYRGKNVLLVFYLGDECEHCVEQLVAITKRIDDFTRRNTVVIAVSSKSPEINARTLEAKQLPMRLLSDVSHDNARRFHSYDDFEDLELHSTILIDANGKVRWARNGGEPFQDLDLLTGEIDRWSATTTQTVPRAAAAGG